jgi:hypothetical protein
MSDKKFSFCCASVVMALLIISLWLGNFDFLTRRTQLGAVFILVCWAGFSVFLFCMGARSSHRILHPEEKDNK